MTDPTLLATTRATVARWPGWRVTRTYRDDSGDWGWLSRYKGDPFLCVCKRTLHDGRASFMKRAVSRARGEGYACCEFVAARYVDDKPSLDAAWVFDADTVAARGTASAGASAKGKMTDWIEVPVKWGVLLGEYVSGRASLPPPADVPQGQITLDSSGLE